MRLPHIESPDWKFAEAAQARWDTLVKPKGSLGRLESVVTQICAIRQTTMPSAKRKKIILFAGDHGVAEEGVSAYPQAVTMQMVSGFIKGNAAICVLARSCGIEIEIVDAGIREELSLPGLITLHIRNGTRNFVHEPAMTAAEVEQALDAGIQLAINAAKEGVDLIAGGEMGIGNTTSAGAIYSALLDLSPRETTGYGTGIDQTRYMRKLQVVEKALQRARANNPLDILQEFGGYEIACLTGLYIGAASARVPVVIDGFICTAAAAVASRMLPGIQDYFLFAHRSAEGGFSRVLQELGVTPLLDLEMRLGEGTGAALAMQLIENAVRLYTEMPTFEQAEVSGNHL